MPFRNTISTTPGFLRYAIAIIVAVGSLFAVGDGLLHAGEEVANLKWTNSAPPGDVEGYRLHFGKTTGIYPETIDVPSGTRVSLYHLEPETRYFCIVTAYNKAGLESSAAQEFSFETPMRGPSILSLGGDILVSVEGKAHRRVHLYESADMINWSLRESYINETGLLDLTDMISPGSGGKMFYRFLASGELFSDWIVANGVQGGPNGDSNGDGIRNGIAFASGANRLENPHEVSPQAELIEEVQEGEMERFLTFTYTIREDEIVGVFPSVEYSDDVVSWQDASARTEIISNEDNGDGTRTITVKDLIPVSANPSGKCYFRLRVDFP